MELLLSLESVVSFIFSPSTRLELLRIIIEPLVAEFKGLYGIATLGKTCTRYFQIIF